MQFSKHTIALVAFVAAMGAASAEEIAPLRLPGIDQEELLELLELLELIWLSSVIPCTCPSRIVLT